MTSSENETLPSNSSIGFEPKLENGVTTDSNQEASADRTFETEIKISSKSNSSPDVNSGDPIPKLNAVRRFVTGKPKYSGLNDAEILVVFNKWIKLNPDMRTRLIDDDLWFRFDHEVKLRVADALVGNRETLYFQNGAILSGIMDAALDPDLPICILTFKSEHVVKEKSRGFDFVSSQSRYPFVTNEFVGVRMVDRTPQEADLNPIYMDCGYKRDLSLDDDDRYKTIDALHVLATIGPGRVSRWRH